MPHKFKDASFLIVNSFCVAGLINLISYNVVLVNASVEANIQTISKVPRETKLAAVPL